MKLFLSKIVIKLIPFILVVMVIEGFWLYNRELASIDYVLDQQMSSEDQLYYLRKDFSSNDNTYKLKAIDRIKPEILVIGTSRVLEFRNFMFSPFQEQFYTAGGSVQNVYDVENYIQLIKTGKIHKPKLLIIGIDSWLLKDVESEENSWIAHNAETDDVLSFRGHHNAFKYMFKNLIVKGKVPELREGNIGYGSYGKTGFGYRKDGSVHYNMYIEQFLANPTYVDREDPPIIERIVKKTHQFEMPFLLSEEKERLLMNSIAKVRSMGIEVLLFFPPFSNRCYQALENSTDHAAWWTYYKTLPEKFRAAGMDVMALMRPRDIRLDDRYMIDGYHPSEVLIAHMFLEFLKAGNYSSETLKEIDQQKLFDRINNEKVIPISFMNG